MREIIATGKTVEAATEAACIELGKSRDEVSVEILEMPVKKLFRKTPAKVKVQLLEEVKPKAEPKPEPKEKETKKAEPIDGKKITQKPQENKTETAEKKDKDEKKESVLEKEPEIKINIQENHAVKNAVNYLQTIFKAVGAENIEVTAFRQGEATLLRIEGEELGNLLEIRGETIQALSYLVDRSVNRGVDKRDDQYLKIRLDIEGYRNRREQELIALAQRTATEVEKTKRSRTLAPMNPYERLIVHTTISEIEGVVSESIGSDLDRRVVIRSTDGKAPDRDNGRGRRNTKRSKPNNRNRNGQNKSNKKPYDNEQNNKTAPPREYADKKTDEQVAPIVPKRREAVSDGDDVPLYGKIEL